MKDFNTKNFEKFRILNNIIMEDEDLVMDLKKIIAISVEKGIKMKMV